MNVLSAKITHIVATQELCLVDFSVGHCTMSMVALELNKDLKKESRVVLGFKATAVNLAKGISDNLSFSNKLKAQIASIKKGEILSSVKLKFENQEIESIITTRSLDRLALKEGDDVTALIKASELSIVEVTL